MTSKEALKDILDILMNFERLSNIHDKHEVKKHKFELLNENNLDKEIDLETWEFTKEVVKDE